MLILSKNTQTLTNQFNSIQFNSTQLNSTHLNSTQLNSTQFIAQSKQAQYREELDAQCNARKADKAAADQYVVSETALKDRPF